MTTKNSSSGATVKSVNSQITDAVTQSNVMVTGMAPANSMATLYQTMSQSVGTSLQNSVSNQQNVNSVNLAALAQNLQIILQPFSNKSHTTQLPLILQNLVTPLSEQDPEKPTKQKL